MHADMSFFGLISGASIVVQLVMLLLLAVSVLSWTLIFRKWMLLRAARDAASEFEDRFWSGGDLATLYRDVAQREDEVSGLSSIFLSGFKEFARLRGQKGSDPMAVVEGAKRSMRVSLAREVDDLETHLSFLATVGSTSPYIGLFGTVWGIMNSFVGIGRMGSANLAVVAPGISEALVATAAGLAAAIPAVIAFNFFMNKIRIVETEMQSFSADFLNIIERDILRVERRQ